jgi:signal transduction histidine kinase
MQRWLLLRSILSVCSFLSLALFIAGPAVAQDVTKNSLTLTSIEKTWLDQHPEIRLAIDTDWAPFEFVDEQKQYRGMAADYIHLVEERLGIAFEVDRERPWSEMVEAVKNRDLDAFSLVVRTPQRDQFVNFTKPYISFPMVIVSLENEPYIDGIEALRNRTVAVVNKYASHDLLAENHPFLKFHLSKNVRQGLEAVSQGRAFAFVGNLAVVSQVIREAGITNIKVSGQTPYRFELSMAVRKDWPEFVPILQKALDSISPEDRDEIYNQWIRVKFQKEFDYRVILGILAIALLIISVIVIWNKKLQREIVYRTKAEEALQLNKDQLESVVVELEASKYDLENQATQLVELAENEALLSNKLKYEAAVKNRFFSIISHDLKSPFNALLGMTELMSKMADSFTKDQLVESAANVNEAGKSVFGLLQNLLEWSRLQMEGATFEPQLISLHDLTLENIDVLSPAAKEKGISLSNEVKKDTAFADPDMIQTVIRNLISNSLKFTPSGGKIEISSSTEYEVVKVTVSDTGVGIPAEQADKIFALDQKTSTNGTAGETGTGLGLPLCKEMIEQNGGKIWVESTPGEGSQFHFTLPTEQKEK